MNRQRGFSLLELMLVVAIVAFSLVLVLPGYQRTIIKSHRTIGKAALLELVSRQEQFFMSHKRYSDSLGELGLGQQYLIDGTASAVAADKAIYRIELALSEGQYTGVRAVPLNRQLRDVECGTLGLSQLGERSVTGHQFQHPDRCW